jgi:hypothetical protein
MFDRPPSIDEFKPDNFRFQCCSRGRFNNDSSPDSDLDRKGIGNAGHKNTAPTANIEYVLDLERLKHGQSPARKAGSGPQRSSEARTPDIRMLMVASK